MALPAAAAGHLDVLTALVWGYFTDPNFARSEAAKVLQNVDKAGKTARMLAEEGKHNEVVQFVSGF